jgi:YidC/Oxa1 family membrane protein insertase
MEKRALLAALLSAVVLVVWYSLFGPQPVPPPPPQQEVAPAANGAAVPTPAGGQVTAEVPPAVAGQPGEEEVVVVADGVRAVVNPRGGVIRSLVLERHQDGEGNPLELVEGGAVWPLALAAEGPWNEAWYAVEREASGVTLFWSDGQGAWVRKRIRPGSGAYALEVSVEGGGAALRDGVVVARALRPAEKAGKSSFGRSGAVVGVGGKVKRLDTAKLKGVERFGGGVGFAGVENQYFLLCLLPEGHEVEVAVEPLRGVVVRTPPDGLRGVLFAGAKEHQVLKGYGRGLDGTISFGIFGVLSVAFLAAMRWIYSWTGNWGVAIVVLTAAIRVLLFPLTHKSTVAMRRMQRLQPKMKAIQDRYKERAKRDPQVRQRMNQEIMQLYRVEGVNPMSGCLPTLVQLPILWALYTLFAYAIELRHAPFVWWIRDLSAKDPTYITPILMTASMVLQQKMTPQAGDPAQRRMFMLLPFVFGLMFINFPAGLVLYWLVNNLLTIGQQLLTNRLAGDSERA